jgi:FkbM family methyltransferase
LRLTDHVAQRLLLSGRFEPEVAAAIVGVVRSGMIVADIGANIGVHTLQLARIVGPDGKVLAFEPNPVARQELETNLRLNGIKHVQVLELALCDHDGIAPFQFPEEGEEAMGGLIATSRFTVARVDKVETARLDEVISRLALHHLDFIKIDVEGAELNVLKGAGELLMGTNRPTILYESVLVNTNPYGYTPNDMAQFLKENEYSVHQIDDENFLGIPREKKSRSNPAS